MKIYICYLYCSDQNEDVEFWYMGQDLSREAEPLEVMRNKEFIIGTCYVIVAADGPVYMWLLLLCLIPQLEVSRPGSWKGKMDIK